MIKALTPKMRLLLFTIITFVAKALSFHSYVVMLFKCGTHARGTYARGTYAARFEKKNIVSYSAESSKNSQFYF